MRLQLLIGGGDQRLRIHGRILQQQHGMHDFFVAGAHRDHHAFLDAGLAVEHRLDILRINVQTLGGDDHLLLAALVIQAAFGVHLADIAGVQPAVFDTARDRSAHVFSDHAFAAYQNFAIGRDANFLAGYGFADRSAARAKRMIERYDRAGFGEPIALDHEKTQTSPERLDACGHFSAADNHGPEFVTQRAMDMAIAPPAFEYSRHTLPALLRFRQREAALDLALQRFEKSRHGHQHGDSLAADRVQNRARIEIVHEHSRPAQQRWNKNAKRLAEQVAKR